ncbi:MAG: sigma 54-interacting transcriptional regulator [Labilithrix sp.]
MATVRQPAFETPIATLAVEVVHGPDRGLARTTESDTCTVGTATDNHLVLTDRAVSRYHVDVVRRADGIGIVDQQSTNGTWLGALRLERAVLPPGTIVRIGDTQLRLGEGPAGTIALHPRGDLAGMVGESPPMRRLFAQIERAARSEASVLVLGESGTGKELVARSIHELGPRAAGPIVTVDCGSVAPALIASELFGHERGAFTGASHQHVGALERAHGGTIFFDEIGELPLPLQSSLLGVLQRRRFRRVGGREEIPVDVRVVSATHRDLRAEVNAGTFRLDLFYRLAVVTLRVPALRERSSDVPLLVQAFLREAGAPPDVFSDETLAQLAAQRWSGNVRELRNLVESTLAMGELASELPAPLDTTGRDTRSASAPYREARARVLDDFEHSYLHRLYERTGGNVSLAAREARMDRSHLVTLLKKHGVK